jgi:tripartite-type tricarboxylate transporter receptor subunit TctC
LQTSSLNIATGIRKPVLRTWRRVRIGLLLFIAALVALPVKAQSDFPTKAIRLIVPFPAGSSPDVIARLWGDRMSRSMGKPVVIDNRPGAATIIGAQAVATAAADGYTLLYTVGSTTSINPYVYTRLPYKADDFLGIARTTIVPYVLVVPASSKIRSVADLLLEAKRRDGEMNYASYGVGQTTQVVMARFLNATGVQMRHVPYKDGGINDLIGDVVNVSFEPSTTAIPLIQGGKLRGLAVTSGQRLPTLADVPSLSETIPGFSADSWQGVLAPKATPDAVLRKISSISQEVSSSEEFRVRARDLGLVAVRETPEEFQKFMLEDARLWSRVVQDNKIRAD